MKSRILLIAAVSMVLALWGCGTKKTYESVDGDPMAVRIYTLENGLKVYMSVNPEEPRIQANIAVRVGSKNDPAETTGLSHYLEHIMFKGTHQYGTMNYELEKPFLDQIESLYEEYRTLTDPDERKAMYRKIDSVSNLASEYSIPNEYDKLMSAIGAWGTNAYTSFDETVYVENIPSNQLEAWAMVQADRFQNLVVRGFHTELEAVYEEKNMSMDRDYERQLDSLLYALFPEHPYGLQTTIGTQEHLKNPSIVNIKKHYDTYYVPNNMAICLAGDFDPDQAIEVIKKYFGGMTPSQDVPKLPIVPLSPLEKVRETNTYGLQAEGVCVGWRTPGPTHADNATLEVVSELLSNGKAGLLDVNVAQKLKALEPSAFTMGLSDYDALVLVGCPLEGQTLEEVRDVLLAEVDKLRNGDFDEAMLTSIVNNQRYTAMRNMESNRNRVQEMVSSFIHQTPWAQSVNRLDEMKKITKQQVIDFANKYLLPHSYAVSYKRFGENTSRQEIAKPLITPIKMNRDTVSEFVRRIQNLNPTPIEPQFVDFNATLEKFQLREGVNVILSKNPINSLFRVEYVFDFGTSSSKLIGLGADYLQFLSSDSMSLQQFNDRLYSLAAGYSLSAEEDQTTLAVWGLNENIGEVLQLVEYRLRNLVADKEGYQEFAGGVLKQRADAKLDQNTKFEALREYMIYGEHNPYNTVLTNAEVSALDPQVLVDELKGLLDYPHTVIYYAPADASTAKDVLAKCHPAGNMKSLPTPLYNFVQRQPKETQVYVADYESAQVLASQYACEGRAYDLAAMPSIRLFNEYFGGSMNAVVFQEIREARALAYNASAYYRMPDRKERFYAMTTFVGTQTDKMQSAFNAFSEILANMPVSESAFDVAKDAVLMALRTNRYTQRSIPRYYLYLQKLGLNEDPNREIFAKVPAVTMEQVASFQQQYVKGLTYDYAVMGDLKKLDMGTLKSLGNVTILTDQALFGY